MTADDERRGDDADDEADCWAARRRADEEAGLQVLRRRAGVGRRDADDGADAERDGLVDVARPADERRRRGRSP